MALEYLAPLGLKMIFQNTLSGNVEIFMAIFFIGMSILAGLFRMRGETFLLMMALAGILLVGWLGGGFYLLLVIMGGLIVYWMITRLVK